MIENYVIGGGGFVGAKLLERLAGSETVQLDWRYVFNLTYLQPHRRFFYLASYGNMAHHDQASSEILAANLTKPAHILDILVRKKIPCESFVYVSTSSVTLPVQTTYSRTKRAAEEMLLAYQQIPALIIRPYSITGVGEQKEHLIPRLIDSCMAGTPMDFVGEPTHDWIDVDDVVNGLLLLSDKRGRGIYQLGTGFLNSNNDILDMVQRACGEKANISRVKSMRNYDCGYWCCDSVEHRAENEGWFAAKRINESIREMVGAYKNEHA